MVGGGLKVSLVLALVENQGLDLDLNQAEQYEENVEPPPSSLLLAAFSDPFFPEEIILFLK